MPPYIDRRQMMQRALGIGFAAGLSGWPDIARAVAGASDTALGNARPFSFATLQSEAETLARSPYVKPLIPAPETLAEIDYDQYQKIRFRADKSLMLDRDGRMPVQLFHLGKYATEPVRMFVVSDGAAREVIYQPALFDIPDGHPAKMLEAGAGFAGFALWRPTKRPIGLQRSARRISAHPGRTTNMASRLAVWQSTRPCRRRKSFRAFLDSGSKARRRTTARP